VRRRRVHRVCDKARFVQQAPGRGRRGAGALNRLRHQRRVPGVRQRGGYLGASRARRGDSREPFDPARGAGASIVRLAFVLPARLRGRCVETPAPAAQTERHDHEHDDEQDEREAGDGEEGMAHGQQNDLRKPPVIPPRPVSIRRPTPQLTRFCSTRSASCPSSATCRCWARYSARLATSAARANW